LLMLVGVAHFRLSRRLRKLGATRRARIVGNSDPTRVPATVPPGPLTVVEHRVTEASAREAPRDPRGASTLFLRMFRAETNSLLVRLTQVGPVYMLLGGNGLVSDLGLGPRIAFGRIDRFIEENEAEVLQRLATFSGERRSLGYYRRYTMICSDDIWTFALDRLVERAKVVIVDLCGFTPGSAGLDYEFGVLLDRVPLGRVIFVAGPDTERSAFDARIRERWATLPDDSVNYSAKGAVMHIAMTTALAPITRRGDEETQRRLDLQRRELDMIVGLIGDAMLRIPPDPGG